MSNEFQDAIQTEWGELYFEECGDAYCLFPAPDFVECVLYDYISDNSALMDAVNDYHLEEEPLFSRDADEYNSIDAAFEDFKNILEEEYGVPVLES